MNVATALSDPAPAAGLAARHAIRQGHHQGPTANLAFDCVQANLVIVPAAHAFDFLRYCQANPKPCPVLAVGEPGDPHLPTLGEDLDLRTDLPRYRLWRDGEHVDTPTDITPLWRSDAVAFALGCSFSFEAALVKGGIPLRHWDLGRNVAMYRTNRPTVKAGPFQGPLVVSMRPLRPAAAVKAIQICSRFPAVHGAPVHLGLPEDLGIADLARPDYGDPVPVLADELPLFWACGVTPQAALLAAKLPWAITHDPGHMLVTDLTNDALAAL
ncbi:MAG: putative hydro-lyase [Candidatus Competibacterales bacterium]